MDLQRIIEDFEAKHTCQLADRHAQNVQQLCVQMDNELSQEGFFYKDLVEVARILDLIYKGLLEKRYILLPALRCLLKVIRIPFQKAKSSDELTEVPRMKHMLDSLCQLLFLQPKDTLEGSDEDHEYNSIAEVQQECDLLRGDIADTITEIASQGVKEIKEAEPTSEDKLLYGQDMALPLLRFYKNGNRNMKVIFETAVAASITELLMETSETAFGYSVETKIALLEALAAITIYEPIAQACVEMDVGRDLVRIIKQTADFRSYVVALAIEVQFNLIEVGGPMATQKIASYPESVSSLKAQFDNVMARGYKKDDKCLRNELCVLLNFIVSSPDSYGQFLHGDQNSVFTTMCSYAVFDEQNEAKPLLTTSEEDLELKKLLWTQIFEIIRGVGTPEIIQLAIERKFFSSLMLYLDPKICSSANAIMRWSESQLIELQTHALNIVCHLIPYCTDRLMELNCPQLLSTFLKTYTDKQRRKAAMLALQSIARLDYVKDELSLVIEPLLSIVADQKMEGMLSLRELSLTILSLICTDNRANQKILRRESGIETLINNLQYTEVDHSGNGITFLGSVLDCLSNSVFGNKRSELHFLDVEGVYVLLDLIETCDYTVKRLAVSCLCTVLENAKAFSYFVEWNSKRSSMNASQLLIELYKNEDKRFGVVLADGIITSVHRPLFPEISYLKQKYGDLASAQTIAQQTTDGTQPGLNQTEDYSTVEGDQHDVDGGSLPQAASGTQSGNNKQQESVLMQESTQDQARTMSKSKASRVLRLALDAAAKLNEKEKDSESYLNAMLTDLVKSYDIRACVFATFFRVGFDLHELNAFEKQYMELVQLYPYLKNGEIWKDIKQELDDLNVKPTSDDKHWMDSAIELSNEQTEKAISNQQKILSEVNAKEQKILENYFSAIRIKSEITSSNPATNTKKSRSKDQTSNSNIGKQ